MSLTKPAGAKYANLRLETAQIRFTLDGSTAPTTSVGRIMEVGEIVVLESKEEIANFAAIRTGATSGVLDIEYSGEAAGTESD